MIKDHKKDISDLLKNVELFSSLSAEELNKVKEKIEMKRFRKNEVILYEENTNEVMYVILLGKVKVIQTSEDGKEIILAIHGSGDFFGEMSLIDGKTAPAMVVAREDSVVAIITKKEFYSLIQTQGELLKDLLRILCSRLRDSWERIQLLSFNNASQRIRMLFIMLANEYGKKSGEETLLNIKLTHQDIADMAGITRETVTRVIDKLHKDGEIRVLKNKFIVLGRDFLQQNIKNCDLNYRY